MYVSVSVCVCVDVVFYVLLIVLSIWCWYFRVLQKKINVAVLIVTQAFGSVLIMKRAKMILPKF